MDIINNNEKEENHPDQILVQDCKNLNLEMDTPIRHIPVEANHCTYKITKIDGTQKEQMVRMMVPRDLLLEDLIEDIKGEGLPRGTQYVFMFPCLKKNVLRYYINKKGQMLYL